MAVHNTADTTDRRPPLPHPGPNTRRVAAGLPFYGAWSAGELSLDDLRAYAAQYHHFEAELPTLLSGVHSRFGDSDVRQSILDNLCDEEHGEANHRAPWLDSCEASGLGPDEPDATGPLPTTRAMLERCRRIRRGRTFQEGLAATCACEEKVPAAMVEKMRGHFGIDGERAMRFFEVHGVLDEDHSGRERDGIVGHTGKDLEPAVEAALQEALDGW